MGGRGRWARVALQERRAKGGSTEEAFDPWCPHWVKDSVIPTCQSHVRGGNGAFSLAHSRYPGSGGMMHLYCSLVPKGRGKRRLSSAGLPLTSAPSKVGSRAWEGWVTGRVPIFLSEKSCAYPQATQ